MKGCCSGKKGFKQNPWIYTENLRILFVGFDPFLRLNKCLVQFLEELKVKNSFWDFLTFLEKASATFNVFFFNFICFKRKQDSKTDYMFKEDFFAQFVQQSSICSLEKNVRKKTTKVHRTMPRCFLDCCNT